MKMIKSKVIASCVLMFLTSGSARAQALIDSFAVASLSESYVDVNPVTNMVYASGGARYGDPLTIVNSTTRAIVTTVTGSGAHVNPKTNRVYAGVLSPSELAIFDGSSGTGIGTVALAGCAFETAVDTVANRVWIGAQCGGDLVFAVDGGTNAIQSPAGGINIGGVMGYIAVNPVTHYLYVYASSVTPKRINPATWAVSSVSFTGAVYGVNAATNTLYAEDPGGTTIQIISGSTETVTGSLSVNGPIAVNSVLNRVYVFDRASLTIKVFDGSTNAAIGTLSPPPNVNGTAIAVNSSTGLIYLLRPGMVYVLRDIFLLNTAPLAPKNLAAAPGNGLVTLRWKKNTEPDFLRYRIYRGTVPAPTVVVDSTTAGIGDTTRTMGGLVNGTRYYFRITAVDSAGLQSPYSNEVSVIPTVPPVAPQGLAATPGNGQVVLKWRRNAEGDFLRYRIYAAKTHNPVVQVDSTTGGISDTAHTVIGLTNDSTYYFRITAVDSAGLESPFSTESSAKPNGPPAPPQNLAATPGDASVALTWSANTEKDLRRYRIYMGTVAGAEAFADSTALPTDTSRTITGLTNGTPYYFRITAADSSGLESSASSEVTATPVAAPIAPLLLAPVDGAANQSLQPVLSWGIAATASSYRLQVGTISTLSGGMTVDTTLSGTSAHVGPLNPTTTYYWHVRAQNTSGSGSYSGIRSFTTTVNRPVITLAPAAALDFGPAGIGASAKTDTLVISNRGGTALSVTSMTLSGAQAAEFALIGVSLPLQVPGLQSVTVNLSFAPQHLGARTALLTIASNDPTSPTVVDTLRGTGAVASPPGPPTGLTILPSGWTRTTAFTVSFNPVADPSGIAKLLYRIDTPPTKTAPGDSVPVTNNSAVITVPGSGAHVVYVYLADSAGLRDPANNATLNAKVDLNPPVVVVDVSHVPAFDDSNNPDVPIGVTTTDNLSGMKSLEVQYRGTGRPWTSATPLAIAGATGGSATIPGGDIFAFRLIGIDYRARAVDSVGNIGYSPTYSLHIELTNEYTSPTPLTGTRTLPAGTPLVSAYRLISVPFILSDKTPVDIFENKMALGSYDPKKWRFFSLNIAGEWDEYPLIANQSLITPGRSFLFISRDGAQIRVGSGVLARGDSVSAAGISLRAGYNLVGNPFGFNVLADSLSLANGQPLTGHRWEYTGVGGNSGWVLDPDTMKPWSGWLIDAGNTGPTTLEFSVGSSPHALRLPSTNSLARFARDSSLWSIRLAARRSDNGMVDEENVVGVSTAASDDRDVLDVQEPPQVGEDGISLSFDGSDGRLTHDYRSPRHDGWTWDFVVRSPQNAGIVHLSLHGDGGSLPVGYLLDLDSRVARSLRDVKDQSVATMGSERHFRLVVGSRDYLAANTAGIELLPREYALAPNFPNPFNPSTTIRFGLPVTSHVRLEVYDILGRLVEVLVDGERDAGFHEVLWTPRGASGVYFCRLDARPVDSKGGSVSKTRRMVLLR